MTKPQSPCLGCKERVAEPNCHGYCEKYIAFRNELDRQNAEKYKQKQIYLIGSGIEVDRIRACTSGKLYKSKYNSKKRR